MYVSALWHHNRTIRIYHHQWGSNQPWERSPCRHVMEPDKPKVASSKLNTQGRLPSCLWPTIKGRPDFSEYRGKWDLNGWINWWHHHHYHWQPMLGGARQERRFIDHPHHIQTLSVRQTPETRWPPLTPQARRRNPYFQEQDLYGLGHLEPFYTVIPPARKGDILGTQHQGIHSFNGNKYRQARIPNWKAQSYSSHHNTSEVLSELTPKTSK